MIDSLNEFRNILVDVHENSIKRSDKLWESFSNEDQLDLFLAVVRRIYKGEFEEKGSYRHVLYDTFGFGPESYTLAQMDGFLDIHNACVKAQEK